RARRPRRGGRQHEELRGADGASAVFRVWAWSRPTPRPQDQVHRAGPCPGAGSLFFVEPLAPRLMQPGPLEEGAAVAGFHLDLETATVAFDRERNPHARRAERPDGAEERRELLYPGTRHPQHHIA